MSRRARERPGVTMGPASGGQTRKRVCDERPQSGRCTAALRPRTGPNLKPPRTAANPRGMRGWGPLAGVKRASAFAGRNTFF